MRAVLIVNPHATSTTERRRDLLTHALASQVKLTVEHTAGRGHAIELAAKAVETGADLVVAHGGDGTVNEVVNGLMRSEEMGRKRPALAVVPGGSTNVFARAVGIEADPIAATEQILEALTTGRPARVVSLGRADDRYFTFNAGLGLDAEVVHAVEVHRATGKAISNSLHVRQALAAVLRSDRSNPRMTLRLPDREPVKGVHLVFVSNVDPWTYWEKRPVRTNPQTSAAADLGVFALTSLRVPTLLRMAGQLLRAPGTERANRGPRSRHLIRTDDVTRVQVQCATPVGLQVDGDYLGLRTAVTFTSVPQALRIVGPVAPIGPSDRPTAAR